MKDLKDKKDAESRHKRSLLLDILQGYITPSGEKSETFSVRRKSLTSKKKKQTKNSKKQVKKQQVEEQIFQFFEEMSTPLPNKKKVSKKTGRAKAQLQRPLKDLYKLCKQQGGKASFATFAKCRPTHIKTTKTANLRQCLCEYCQNCELKLQAVDNLCTKLGVQRLGSLRDAVQLTLCAQKTKDCCYRQCSDCGLLKLEEHLAPLQQEDQDAVTWQRGTTKKCKVNGKETSRKVLETKRGPPSMLIQELLTELTFLSEHLFRADWQHSQFKLFRDLKPFPKDTAVMVLDFAENYTCLYQDEVQAAHWHHNQVTVHPVCTSYACNNCEKTVHENLIFLSNDLTHDHHAVHAFVEVAINHLKERVGSLRKIVEWSDGCSAQYKSKGPFADVASGTADFDIDLYQRNYFGSHHGKGPSDSESAIVKSHVTRAVKSGLATVGDAREMFQYLLRSVLHILPKDGCHHFKRTFFYIPGDDINRHRPHCAVETVGGTKTFHQVISGGPGTITTRHLTCFCQGCISGVGDCMNIGVVGHFTEHTLVPEKEPQVLLPPEPETTAPCSAPRPAARSARRPAARPSTASSTNIPEEPQVPLPPEPETTAPCSAPRPAARPSTASSTNIPEEREPSQQATAENQVPQSTGPCSDNSTEDEQAPVNTPQQPAFSHYTTEEESLNSARAHRAEIDKHMLDFVAYLYRKNFMLSGEMPMDGNCFFWALDHQMAKIGMQSPGQRQLRQMSCQFLQNLPVNEKQQLQQFILDKTFEQYVADMSKDGCYVDNVIVEYIGRMLGLQIRILQSPVDATVGPAGSDKILHIGYLPRIEHYVSVQHCLGQIVTEQYYAVDYVDHIVDRFYIGRVLGGGAKPGFYRMKFLHQTSKDGQLYFSWPRKDDLDEVYEENIFFGPVKLHGCMEFTIPDIADIVEKFHC